MQKEVTTNFETTTRGTADTKEIACIKGKDSVFSVMDRLRQHIQSILGVESNFGAYLRSTYRLSHILNTGHSRSESEKTLWDETEVFIQTMGLNNISNLLPGPS